jgi:hypothetical protein
LASAIAVLIVDVYFGRGIAIFFEYSLFKKEGRPWEGISEVEGLWKFCSSWMDLDV